MIPSVVGPLKKWANGCWQKVLNINAGNKKNQLQDPRLIIAFEIQYADVLSEAPVLNNVGR